MSQGKSKRPICPSCSKPTRTCLCSRILTPPIPNSVNVTILQHALESNHPLNSTRIAKMGLKNLTIATVSDINTHDLFCDKDSNLIDIDIIDSDGLKNDVDGVIFNSKVETVNQVNDDGVVVNDEVKKIPIHRKCDDLTRGRKLLELEVKIAKKILISYRDRVRIKVKTTHNKTEILSDVVFEWLNETEILIQEVENLMAQARTQHLDEFTKLAEKVKAHNMKFELLDPFSTPIPSLEGLSNGNILCFKSREKATDQLLVALQDDTCSVIGLYGRKGSGKTTLVKAMGEKVKYLKIFHEVLFVKVTQNPNIRTMQDEIADSLNLIFDKNSEAGRARRIFSTIESMNCPILVIFDDVRAKFDLEDVGIPCNSNFCKIVLTTCYRQDCELMYCQREIQLDPLSSEEAWFLFRKHSVIHENKEYYSSDLLDVAEEVAFECEGLPRTIKDVGYSLRILEEKIHATLLHVFSIKLYLKGGSRLLWMMEDCTLETKFHPLF
ncbi:TIR-similar-domain-containing protein TSDC [Trifolium pratense]|uniref:tRNA-uridine aminocarboxypropyltransferase n=1 Tax=Trifolium pratense TaxID=57577 RepID=A0A2K3MWK6_TRIPR|nr:TIR-similar-domain-containing protein TSDC [Trifolium pratense]